MCGDGTKITLGKGDGVCAFTLGQTLKAWRGKNDRFDPLAMKLAWPACKATVSVELVAPMKKKLAVCGD